MKTLSAWFYKISKGWVVLTVLAIFVAFCALTLPRQNKSMEKYSRGIGSPDTSFLYSSARLYQMADLYGEEGRHQYVHARWTFDLAFPMVYGIFLVTSISWLFNKGLKPDSKRKLLNLFPLLAVLADYLENSMTSLVFIRFPIHVLFAERLAPILTSLKWFMIITCFMVVIVGMVAVIRSKQKKGLDGIVS